MQYGILRLLHLLGLTLIGAGLIGVWYADLRSRRTSNLLDAIDAWPDLGFHGSKSPSLTTILACFSPPLRIALNNQLTPGATALRDSSCCGSGIGRRPYTLNKTEGYNEAHT